MIKVDFDMLPPQYNVIRGYSVSHIIEYEINDLQKELLEGRYLCDKTAGILVVNSDRFYQPHSIANISQEYLTCKKCANHYNKVTGG